MAFGYGNSYGNSYGLADPVVLLLPLEDMLPLAGLSSNAGSTPPLPLGERGLIDADPLESGALTDAQPVSPHSSTLAGVKHLSFFDDFYNRYHLISKVMDFGIVVSESTMQAEIWNAHLVPGTLDGVFDTELDFSQVAASLPALPQTLPALGVTSYNVTAEAAGPTDIEGHVYFFLTPTETLTLTVSGVRGRLWPFLPNWSGGFREVWEYKTEVITSRAGREQRMALRTTPRKTVEYASLIYEETRREFSRALDKYHHVDHVVADIPRHVVAVSEVPAIAGPVTVDEIPDWIDDNQVIVIVNGRDVNLRYVDTVDEDNNIITLKNDGAAMPAGSYICFGMVGNIDPNIQTRRLTNEAAEVVFRFRTSPGREDYLEPPAAAETYSGREVFLTKPNWSDPVSIDFERSVNEIDYGRGVITRFVPIPFGAHLFRATFTNRDYAAAKAIRDTFIRMRGQRGEFFMPTWEADMMMKLAAGSGTASIRIEGTEVAETYASHKVFKSIMVLMNDGTRYYRTATNAFTVDDVNGNDSILQLSATWPVTIEPEDVAMICWMPCCRFATDALTIDWLTDSKARMQLNIRTLEELTAE